MSHNPTFFLTFVPLQLYTELSQCYQALISSEANLRQSHQQLSSLLAQKDKDILELQAQIQQQQLQLQQQQQDQRQMQQQAQHTALYPPLNRQTNFKVMSSLIFVTLPTDSLSAQSLIKLG